MPGQYNIMYPVADLNAMKLNLVAKVTKRIARKKGQHRNSPSHSDLYTDENPKGTIHGLKFATVQDAKDSVKKIESSGKTGFYKMSIVPNKYYYIIFRTLEEEMISNPTEVFRFMMVSYDNGIYLDVQTFELEQPKKREVLTFEKILKIEPVATQYLLNIAPESQSAEDMTNFTVSAPEIDTRHIGPEEDMIWDKKFKATLSAINIEFALPLTVAIIEFLLTKEPSFFLETNLILLSTLEKVCFANNKPAIIAF